MPGDRRGLTVLELLVSSTIITLLLSLLLPGVQSIREASRRIQCQNNFRQIGTALHLHHETHSELPAGWVEMNETAAALGWIPDLLPFLEQAELREQVKSGWPGQLMVSGSAVPGSALSIISDDNVQVLWTPPILSCPSDSAESTFRLFAEETHDDISGDFLSDKILAELPHSNYVGVAGVSDPDDTNSPEGEGTLIHRRRLGFRDLTNGLSHVAVVSERTARRLPSTWLGFHMAGEDAAGRVVGFAFLGPNHPKSDECEFDSRHPGCIQMLFADGHVQVVADEIDADIYRRMAKRNEY